VQRPQIERAEDQQIERAFEQRGLFGGHGYRPAPPTRPRAGRGSLDGGTSPLSRR
jgi:hypothetical protein